MWLSRKLATSPCRACERSLCAKSIWSPDESAAGELVQRRLQQLGHPLPETLEPLADGLAGEIAVVDPLGDHGELEVAERHVPAQPAQVARGAGRVDVHHLLRAEKA